MESTSIVKALILLEATAGYPEGRSLAALATEAGLTKPTAHRILKTLSTAGFLEKTPGGVYRQTPQVQRLVSGADARQLLEAAGPILRELHAATRETINLGILRYDQIVYLQVLESPLPLRRVATDSVDPFHCTALGRAIVAHLPREQRELLLRESSLKKRTPQTVVDSDALSEILAQTALNGYAVEVDQTDVGVTCIAAPVLRGGYPVAAVSLSMPTARADDAAKRRFISAVRESAQCLAAQLDARGIGKNERKEPFHDGTRRRPKNANTKKRRAQRQSI